MTLDLVLILVHRLCEVAHFHDVLKHPAFKQDPMATILEHVQNSIATGAM